MKFSTSLGLISISIVFFVCGSCSLLNGDDETFEAGPILFISDKSGSQQLYSMNEEGEDVKQLTNDSNFPILKAKWSPDGEKIAVISTVGDKKTHPEFRRAVFVMNADGSGRRQITSQWASVEDSARGTVNYGGARYIVWSPDSKQLTFSRLMEPEVSGVYDLFMINADGTNEKRIASPPFHLSYRITDWGTNGNSLWGDVLDFSVEDSTGKTLHFVKLARFDLNGEILESWGNLGETWQRPLESHDGSKIVFLHIDKNHNTDVVIMNPDGSGQIYLPTGMCKNPGAASWSPDDSQILINCFKERTVEDRIFMVNLDGTGVKNITPFKDVSLRALSWRR